MSKTVTIDHFSDLLCVWAYVAQIRIDELRKEFGAELQLNYHFLPVFGSVAARVGDNWKERGGYAGFGAHVLEVAQGFPHVEVHPKIWQGDIPASSAQAHLFIKALQLMQQQDAALAAQCVDGRPLIEEAAWRLRLAFFRDNQNIACREVQLAVAQELGLAVDKIETLMDNGAAMAELCRDAELCRELGISGSPTYVLNEGRQTLYGNVGYKLIAANVHEVLHRPDHQASWC